MARQSKPEMKAPVTAAQGALVGRVVLGRYRALCLLARGGMGEVYLARSEGALGFHRPVVVKRVLEEHAQNKTIVDLFRREAKVMSSLRHPNIVSVLDFGEEGGDHVMVIEYVHGYHLGRWHRYVTKRRPFPVERGVEIMLHVLDALESAHTARGPDGQLLGIVHRDVSPPNVLIDVEGTVKLADFGVARLTGEHTEVADGEVALRGKFPYLSTELLDGVAATPASDTYSAAVVLDEVLRGTNAFRMPKMTDTIARIMRYAPPSLDTVRPDVPAKLARVMSKALAKKVEDRFASAAELAAALREARSSSESDAHRELSQAARADFLDPAMARELGTAELAQLEALWHDPAASVAAAEKIRVGEEPPTLGSAVPGRRRTLAYVAVAVSVIAVAAIAALAWVLTRPPALDAGGPVVIVVDHAASSADAGPAAAAVVDAALAPPTSVVEIAEEEPHGDHGSHRHHDAPIEAPFRARASQISRCFADHVASVEGAPEVVVRFDVARDGSVTSASLVPSAVEPTALGQCLLGIARSTHFSPQPEPVSFRVPLGARRVSH